MNLAQTLVDVNKSVETKPNVPPGFLPSEAALGPHRRESSCTELQPRDRSGPELAFPAARPLGAALPGASHARHRIGLLAERSPRGPTSRRFEWSLRLFPAVYLFGGAPVPKDTGSPRAASLASRSCFGEAGIQAGASSFGKPDLEPDRSASSTADPDLSAPLSFGKVASGEPWFAAAELPIGSVSTEVSFGSLPGPRPGAADSPGSPWCPPGDHWDCPVAITRRSPRSLGSAPRSCRQGHLDYVIIDGLVNRDDGRSRSVATPDGRRTHHYGLRLVAVFGSRYWQSEPHARRTTVCGPKQVPGSAEGRAPVWQPSCTCRSCHRLRRPLSPSGSRVPGLPGSKDLQRYEQATRGGGTADGPPGRRRRRSATRRFTDVRVYAYVETDTSLTSSLHARARAWEDGVGGGFFVGARSRSEDRGVQGSRAPRTGRERPTR